MLPKAVCQSDENIFIVYHCVTKTIDKVSCSHTRCNFPIDLMDSPVTQWNRMRYFLRIFPLCVEY